ncbi:hypothetical protein [Desulfonatronum parangueonense]
MIIPAKAGIQLWRVTIEYVLNSYVQNISEPKTQAEKRMEFLQLFSSIEKNDWIPVFAGMTDLRDDIEKKSSREGGNPGHACRKFLNSNPFSCSSGVVTNSYLVRQDL